MSTNNPEAWIEADKLRPGGTYIIGNNGTATAIGSPSGTWTIGPSTYQNLYDRPDPNTLPELSMTLEMAHGLWAARWGWGWVAMEALQDTAGLNWGRLADRLQRMSLMENFPDTGAYKLVPKTWT